jgi:chitin disaccharide deacetylase
VSLRPRRDGGGDVRGVVLCADDFGLTDGVSRGILDLAGRGRISATSAITTRPHWPAHAPALRALGGRVAAGLHLNLTTAAPLGPMPLVAPAGMLPPLQDLLQRAFLGLLRPAEIRAEIDRQLDAFEDAFGAPPAFVDGHQHVHVLPVIRPALLDALKGRGLAGRTWLRDPSDGVVAIVQREVSANKALVVKTLAIGFRRAARAAGFDVNEGFSGFSPFDAATPPERVFERAFLDLGPRPVVMAHPGHADDELARLDPAVESRPAELAYLRSDAFGRLIEEREIVLTREPAAPGS